MPDNTDNQETDLHAKIKELNALVEFQNNKIYELNGQPLAKKNDELIRRNNDFIVKCGKEHEKAEKLLKLNLDLVLQRDKATLEGRKLQTKVNTLKADIKGLEKSITAYHDAKYTCMALKKDGSPCTRQAKTKINWHGVKINTCLQHSKAP